MRLSATRLTCMAQAGGKTPIQQAIAFLRQLGQDAHVWLPGIGALNGIQAGNWLDPSTVGSLDNPVGRANDGMGVLGVDLLSGAGSFDSATGWTLGTGWSISGGTLNATAATGDVRFLLGTSTVNKSFQVTGVISSLSGGSLNMYVGGFQNIVVNTTGPFSVIVAVTNAASNQYFEIVHNSVPTAVVDNVQVKEITGIHLTQATTASKPVLRRGLLNLLTWSNDFSNAAWVLQGTASKTGANQVNFPGVADKMLQSVTRVVSIGDSLTVAYELSGSGTTTLEIFRNDGALAEGSFSSITLTDTPTLYVVSKTFAAAHTALRCGLFRNTGETATTINVTKAALFQGTLTASDIIKQGGIPVTTTAPASNPNAGSYSWQFDGSNDSLQLSSVPFQMSDDHCVIAGGRFLDTVGNYCFAEQGSALIGLRAIGGKAGAVWYDDGAAHLMDLRGTTTLTSASCVISMRSGALAQIIRLNSVTENSAARPVFGVSTLSSATVGSNLSANYMNGNIGPVIAIKGTVSDANLLLLEKLVANLSGVTLP